MRQKVSIAQALLNSPALLLLDEPTSGLDPIGIKEVRDIILDMQQRGATIFINSHLLSEVERTCSRVAIINKGRIVKSGNKEDLSNKEKYLEIVGEGFTDNLAAQLGAALNKRIDVHGNSMRIFLDHENDALTVHQMVITNGGSITSFNWVTESLEDIFFRLIKGEGA
jgi:ABC-2 type transport system ATP-binding protein